MLFFLCADGALKYRNGNSQYHPGSNGYTNPCLQTSIDQMSTISRPRSSTALTSNGGSPMHGNGRQLNGMLSRGVNGLHEDLDFPPTPRTLTRKKNVVWMRPHVSDRSTSRDRRDNTFLRLKGKPCYVGCVYQLRNWRNCGDFICSILDPIEPSSICHNWPSIDFAMMSFTLTFPQLPNNLFRSQIE
jgi:hypothetical protein